MNRNTPLLIGLLSGIAGGLMVLAAFNAGLLAFFLLFAAPAAVYIASMGWGTWAGLISAVVASIMAGSFGNPQLALVAAALLFAPAAWVGHLTNLGQPAENGSGMVWYPLSAILLRLMAALAIGFILVGFLSGYSRELFAGAFVDLMKQMGEMNPDLPAQNDDALMASAATYAQLLPIIVPCIWLLFHVLTAFIAANITRRSGLLAREPEDVAGTVNLPIEAAGFMAAGLVGTMLLSGTVADAGGVFLGIAIAGYALIGLAQVHYRLRGNPAAGMLLGIVYGTIVLFTVPLFVFTVMGLFRSFTSNNARPPQQGSGPSNLNE